MGGGKSKPQAQPPSPVQGPHHARVGYTSAPARAPAVAGSTDLPAQATAQPASEELLPACLRPAKSHDVETRHKTKAPVQDDINGAAVSRDMSGLRRESSLSSEVVSSPVHRTSVDHHLPKSSAMHLRGKIKSDNSRSRGEQTEQDILFRQSELALTDIIKGKRHQEVQHRQQIGINGLQQEIQHFQVMLEKNSSGQATTQLMR